MTQSVPINSGFRMASLYFFFKRSPPSYAARLITAPKNAESIRKFCMIVFLSVFSADHMLGDSSGHYHDKDGGDDCDQDNGYPYGLQHRPGVQQPCGGRNEHDRHDLDQKIGGFAHLFLLQDSRAEGCKHEEQPVYACGNGKRYQYVQDLAQKRDK